MGSSYPAIPEVHGQQDDNNHCLQASSVCPYTLLEYTVTHCKDKVFRKPTGKDVYRHRGYAEEVEEEEGEGM